MTDPQRVTFGLACLTAVLTFTTSASRIDFGVPLVVGAALISLASIFQLIRPDAHREQRIAGAFVAWAALRVAGYLIRARWSDGWHGYGSVLGIAAIWSGMLAFFLLARKQAVTSGHR